MRDAAARVAGDIARAMFAADAGAPTRPGAAGNGACTGVAGPVQGPDRAAAMRRTIEESAARVAAEIGADILPPALLARAAPPGPARAQA